MNLNGISREIEELRDAINRRFAPVSLYEQGAAQPFDRDRLISALHRLEKTAEPGVKAIMVQERHRLEATSA